MSTAVTSPKRSLPNQPELARPIEGLGTVPCAELAVDVAGVALDGAHGDEELPCCLRVGLARGEYAQHLELALAQRIFESLLRDDSARCLPAWLAQGVGHDAFLRAQFQMAIAGQRIEHLRRLVNGERGSHGGCGRGEPAALLQGAKELFLLLPRPWDGTAGLFVRRYSAAD